MQGLIIDVIMPYQGIAHTYFTGNLFKIVHIVTSTYLCSKHDNLMHLLNHLNNTASNLILYQF